MKFGVIGEPCIDYIHKEGKDTTKKLGGILYSITALAVISGEGHEVYPIMNVGEDGYDFITSFLLKFSNIKLDFVNKVKEKVRVVQLYYRSHGLEYKSGETGSTKTYDREESSTQPIKPVTYEQIKPALTGVDALFINMVSGIDITLETLKSIRKDYNKYIHLDVHNIVMKTYPDGQRLQGAIDNWYEWCSNCDTLQMNESEINIISPKKLKEYDIAYKVLSSVQGRFPKALIITRGKSGVSLFQKKDKNEAGQIFTDVDREDLPAIESINFKDATGCGDTFGAGFFYKNALHEQSDYSSAANFANKLASAKAELMGVEEMVDLRLNVIER